MELTQSKKIFLRLSSVPDMSRIEYFSRNYLYREMIRPYGNSLIEVDDLKIARKLCIDFITHYDLTSSNWTGGLITDVNDEFVAKVSYNGRVWDNNDWRKAKEIILC